ncbi:MAG TPA: protein kinase, partial [Kofleriaceae bacterium]|nr:protein kinase [Kofleriaceae bacterium]
MSSRRKLPSTKAFRLWYRPPRGVGATIGTTAPTRKSVSGEQLTGRKLGDFVVRHRIGVGGYGEVYSAEQPALGRDAVIKVMHAQHRSSKTLIQRFLREARLASKLDHPYAAHIYAFGVESDGLMWIAMEYVRGKTLHELLREHGPMSPEQLVPLLDRICEVLHAAHEFGIVHRDIKPQNVMVVERSGRALPKLLDFGIAKASDGEADVVLEPAHDGEAAVRDGASQARGAAFEGTLPSVAPPLAMDSTVSFVGVLGGGAGQVHKPASAVAVSASSISLVSSADDPALTEDGATLGSPPYMAPEQWADSSTATPRTDMYSLGVLAFEALTGKRPFVAPTLPAMAMEHTHSPVPSLGPGFPSALDGVIAKVLAKQPEARYATVLEFAQEFRAAAGFGSQPLPALEDDLRISVEANYPQPIAEAVSAFHAARNPHQARDALGGIVEVAARYLALIAIAGHAQVRVADSTADAALGTWLRELRRRRLSDDEWLDLARELVRPFAERPQAYPVPELVDLLCKRIARRPSTSAESDELDAPSHANPASDVVHEIRANLPGVARFLRTIAFLADYQLVVVETGRAQSWMGLRRPQRIAVELRGRAIEPGQPVLLDRANRPVLSLWPLVQVSPPLVDAVPEMFFLDGRGRRGARLVALPQPLERQDERVWAWIAERFADGAVDTGASGQTEGTPFRGLASFTNEDAASFVGREREIDAAVNRLRIAPIVVVLGPSGAGKSSFVHAGVVPSLPEAWTAITTRPGTTPLTALQSRLQRSGFAADGLAAAIERDPGALAELLRKSERTTVLVIDQFEELFTLGAPAEQQLLYVRALLAAAADPDDRARVLITLRDDFLARAMQLPALRERLTSSLFFLGTPDRTELVRILTEPLARAGYEFEDRSLPEQMVDAVATTPGALPLLSFTAQQLWDLRDRQFRQLTRRAHDALGGVAGALAQHAERTLAAMSAHEQQLARVGLGHLVTADGTRAVLSRHELQQLMNDAGADAIVEKLIAARLITATESDTGEARIELVHEALLVAWPRLDAWRREDAEGARMRDQVRAAARQWLQRGRPRGLLWRDDAFVELQAWRSRHAQRLTEGDEAFVAASFAEAARGRRLRRGAIALVLAIMAAALAVLVWANRQTTAERNATRAERDRLILAQASGELERDPTAAIAWLRTYPADGAELDKAREIAMDARARGVAMYVLPGTSSVGKFSPDGMRFASTSGDGVRVLDLASGETRLFPVRHILTVSWAPDGARLLLRRTDDGPSTIIDLVTGETTPLGADLIPGVDETFEPFDKDGSVVVATRDGRLVRYSSPYSAREPVWTPFVSYTQYVHRGGRLAALHDGELTWWTPEERVAHRLTRPSDVTFARGSTRVAFLGESKIAATTTDGRLCVWDLAGGAPEVLEGDRTPIAGFVASRDGRLVISLAGRESLRAWRTDLGTSRPLPPVGRISGGAVTPDGRWFFASLEDHSLVLVDPETGGHRRLGLHAVPITGVEVSSDGGWLETEGTDGAARLWPLHDRLSVPFAAHDGPITSLVVAPDGTIITGGQDGHAELWSMDDRRRGLEGHTAAVLALALSGDGATLATASDDHTIRLWNVGNATSIGKPLLVEAGFVQAIVMSPDGRALVSSHAHGDIRIWNVSSVESKLLTTVVPYASEIAV